MINYLKDIKKETLIGQLPDIINNNNESIRNEFNWIFDSSLNRLTKSVYAPTGSVKAHFGEFTNLACEYFTIKNVDSLKTSIQRAVESVIADSFDPSTMQLTNHNILNQRFVNSEFEESNYMHDAASIIYEKDADKYISVKDVLDDIGTIDSSAHEAYELAEKCNNELGEIKTTVTAIEESISELNSSLNNFEELTNADIRELNTAINELSEDTAAIEQSVETTNSSIRKITNSINNLNINLEKINSNNLITSGDYEEIIIIKNQYNFITTPVTNNGEILAFKFDGGDINYTYNFKFILDKSVEKIYLYNSEWYNETGKYSLYINCDNDTYHIDYNNSENLISIIRDNDINMAMCDITLNRYVNDMDDTIVCMLSCKVYEQHTPSEIIE